MIGRRVSHYQIKEELGRGGMGVVYLAVDTRLDRQVALKFLPTHLSADPAARARFIQEAKAASALQHPVICSVYDIGESEDGQTFMVMPFYEGLTVEQRLEDGAFEPEDARSIAAQVADGLAAAHGAGIVHRDIKAANVIVGEGARVTILDFGVAKFGAGADLTKDGSTVGTTSYMSPEQARGEEATEGSDLWSLGVLLHEMVSGAKPFGGGYDAAVAYSIVNQEPAPLPDSVPEDLAEVIGALLQKEPSDRPESASVVRDLLLASRPSDSTPKATPLVTPTMARLAGGILAVALVIFFLSRFGTDDAPAPRALDAIVVFPFDVQAGPELAYLERGMVSMLSPMIDGFGGIRAVDPKAVLGLVGLRGNALIAPNEGSEIAEGFGAGRFLLGSLTRVGTELQISTALYDAGGGLVAEDVRTMPTVEGLMEAAGGALNALLPELIDASASGLTTLALGSTEDYPAMKAYLLAEEAYRAGRFGEAIDLTAEAIEHDSTFAAAWYLGANARSQTLNPDARRYRQGSVRHADGAPRRLQMLIRARAAASEFGWEETVRQLNDVLAFYPDDLDATAYIADQTYHLGPWYGRRATDATPGFQRVLEFDPDNGEYLSHLATILYREGRFAELDSLHRAFVSLGDVPQAEDVSRLHALAFHRDSTLAAVREYSLEALIGSQSTHYATQDLDAARVGLSAITGTFGSNPPAFVELEERSLAAIRGNRAGLAETFLKLEDEDALPAAFAFAELAVSTPYLPLTADSLRGLASILGAPPEDMFEGAPPAMNYPGAPRDHFAYLYARLAERVGDIAAMRSRWIELRDVIDPPKPTQNLVHELEARVLLAEGSLPEALAALERIEHYPGYFLYNGTELHNGFRARFLRAQILFDLGRYREALAWSQTVHDANFWLRPALLPLTYRLEAEAYVMLEDWDNAAERYQRFIDLWENADDDLQPEVEEARRRLQQVLDRGAAEPRS